jgi:hypothetical protein
MPTDRIVASVAEATPYVFVPTELITAFVLGEEKKAKPKPRMRRLNIMNPIAVFWAKKASKISPIVVKAIPEEARICGVILSESLPARGEKIAWTAGIDSNTMPAVCGLKPFVYCK